MNCGVLLRAWIVATVIITAMVPWYTLRLFPVFTVGSAKVNVLDVAVAGAIVLALPAIVVRLRAGASDMVWVCAFVGSMLIPFLHGLATPQSAFYAIRESRALAFYALALVFVAGGFRPIDYRLFAAMFVVGSCVAIVAVFAHVRWLLPIPGYPNVSWSAVSYNSVGAAGVVYLEWTVVVVAFLLSMIGALTSSRAPALVGWTAAALLIVWYASAMSERFVQALILVTAATTVAMSMSRGVRLRRMAIAAAVLGLIIGLGGTFLAGPYWISHAARASLWRWSNILTDDSLAFRYREVLEAFPRFVHHPIFGLGLGSLILAQDPYNPGHPWPYASSGYAFLLFKTGLVGLVLYLTMAGFAVSTALRYRSRHAIPEAWPAGLVGVIGIGLLLVLNVLYPSVDVPEGAIAFSLFYGMIVSQIALKGPA